jgi:hypothetical protein
MRTVGRSGMLGVREARGGRSLQNGRASTHRAAGIVDGVPGGDDLGIGHAGQNSCRQKRQIRASASTSSAHSGHAFVGRAVRTSAAAA